MRASVLIDQIMSDIGVTARDNVRQWIAEALTVIGELSFPWNQTDTNVLTLASVQFLGTGGTDTFSWDEGNSYIECTSPVTAFQDSRTGRRVMLGDEVYKIIDIGLTDPNRIYVDRPIRGSATEQTPTFTRDEYAYRTAAIQSVNLDRFKVPQVTDHTLVKKYWINNHLSTGTSYLYSVDDNAKLPAPEYPPIVTGNTGTAFQDGKYYYFFTRYDEESGLESDPGPVLEYNASGVNFPIVKYDNPAGNVSENTTYKLRLYRSQRNPKDRNCPMFLIDTRTSRTDVSITDENATYPMRNKTQYDWSKQTVIRMYPPPDTTRRSLVVRHNAGYGKRLWDDENINLGTDNAVIEQIRLHCKMCATIQSSDVASMQAAIAILRRQIQYLVTKTRSAGESDMNNDNYNRFRPGFQDEVGNGDWVRYMPNYNMDE